VDKQSYARRLLLVAFLLGYSMSLKMEAIYASETSWFYNQEDHTLHGHHCDNLKSNLNTVRSARVFGGNCVVVWTGYKGQQPGRSPHCLRKTEIEYTDFIQTFASIKSQKVLFLIIIIIKVKLSLCLIN
jgi:hypothetical protein